MYVIDMWYTVKTLLDRGKSLRAISRELGISRKTVTKIRNELQKGNIQPRVIEKPGILDDYSDYILELHQKQLTSVLIHRKLTREKGLKVSYPTVLRYVNRLKQSEVYVPVELPPQKRHKWILATSVSSKKKEKQQDFGFSA